MILSIEARQEERRLHDARKTGFERPAGGTATVSAGVGEGSLDGADQVGTVTAGEYTASEGPGGGGGFGARP